MNAAAGVSDVATVGGTPLEYQVDIRPESLRAYGITLGDVFGAIAKSNMPAGGGVMQKNNAEYIVRGVGWIKEPRDIEDTVIKEIRGVPVYIKNVATVQTGVQFRRSVFEKVELTRSSGVICVELMKKVQDHGFRITEVPVHHFHRTYGRSQFFNVPRVARTLVDLVRLWFELVVRKEHLRPKAPPAPASAETRIHPE